jgi:hypothetical protein
MSFAVFLELSNNYRLSNYRVRSVCTLLALLVMLFVATPAWPDFDERYSLTVGGSLTEFDTKLRINSRDGSIDNEIDIEDELGFDSEVGLGWINGKWRIADRHRLSLLYIPIRRTAELTTSNDIDVGGNTIKAGAFLDSSVKTHVFDIEYIYSFFKRPGIEIGFTAGIYWMNSLAELTAAGEIVFEGEDVPEFRSDYEANQRLIAPLPLIGFTAGYEFNPQWSATAAARYLDVTISDIDGRILNLNLSTEYYFTKHVGAGVALALFDVSVRHNGVVFYNTLTYEYSGLQAYLAFKY